MNKTNKYGMDLYSQFIHLSRYSRWVANEKRRETWEETIKRYFDFMEEHLLEKCNYTLSKNLRNKLEQSVLTMKVMPSMRALMSAGDALRRDNTCAYNCSYIAIDSPRAFDEILYILMSGTGVGFSVERQYINKLPEVPEELYPTESTIVVVDSKLGWSKALKEYINMLYCGEIPNVDTSKVRPAGAPLKTFGGRASGPDQLKNLLSFITNIFRNARGRKLTSIECHDMACKIGEIVVSGGVRRSACLSLSNLSDDRMVLAKSGQWWLENPQRALANNSACYTEKPDIGIFLNEWKSLYESRSGERGIFNRSSAIKQVEKTGRREPEHDFGTNPCAEIILRKKQLCNLTEVVLRKTDTEEDILDKIEIATILGTFQCTLTNFRYLSKQWKNNCEEERLLGVSLTGIMDSHLTNKVCDETKHRLEQFKNKTIEVNKKYSKLLNINQSVAITTVKPSGTISQLVNSSSGIHARYSPYYIRTVRADIKDPLCHMMIDMGFPHEKCVMNPDNTIVFSFPIKSPDGAIFRDGMTAVQQLELWKMYQDSWCEHKPSVTITVKEHEWLEVGAWVYKHFDSMSGVSFLPHSDHCYRQAPYQECTEEEYNTLVENMPKNVDWSELQNYEQIDTTKSSHTLACSSGSCEIVDLK